MAKENIVIYDLEDIAEEMPTEYEILKPQEIHSLIAVPFFILAGLLMNSGGIAKRLINLALLVLGKVPGSLLIDRYGWTSAECT